MDNVMWRLEDGLDMKTYSRWITETDIGNDADIGLVGVYTAVHNFCTSQKAVSNLQATGSTLANHRGGMYGLWWHPFSDLRLQHIFWEKNSITF